jgi:murein DD-endopeptidase MepM/ murein hydrolase activator NlpD
MLFGKLWPEAFGSALGGAALLTAGTAAAETPRATRPDTQPDLTQPSARLNESSSGSDSFQRVLGGWRNDNAPVVIRRGHVTISKASDALGRPIYASLPKPSGADVSAPAMRGKSGSGRYAVSIPVGLPVAATALTSGFGWRRHPVIGGLRAHSGVDLAAPVGSPIVAASDGVVSTADWQGGYGLLVSLDHGGGVQTRYGHMSRVNVARGQRVHRGDVIGFVGSTGLSTGPHLHYEVRVNGRAVNPLGANR